MSQHFDNNLNNNSDKNKLNNQENSVQASPLKKTNIQSSLPKQELINQSLEDATALVSVYKFSEAITKYESIFSLLTEALKHPSESKKDEKQRNKNITKLVFIASEISTCYIHLKNPIKALEIFEEHSRIIQNITPLKEFNFNLLLEKTNNFITILKYDKQLSREAIEFQLNLSIQQIKDFKFDENSDFKLTIDSISSIIANTSYAVNDNTFIQVNKIAQNIFSILANKFPKISKKNKLFLNKLILNSALKIATYTNKTTELEHLLEEKITTGPLEDVSQIVHTLYDIYTKKSDELNASLLFIEPYFFIQEKLKKAHANPNSLSVLQEFFEISELAIYFYTNTSPCYTLAKKYMETLINTMTSKKATCILQVNLHSMFQCDTETFKKIYFSATDMAKRYLSLLELIKQFDKGHVKSYPTIKSANDVTEAQIKRAKRQFLKLSYKNDFLTYIDMKLDLIQAHIEDFKRNIANKELRAIMKDMQSFIKNTKDDMPTQLKIAIAQLHLKFLDIKMEYIVSFKNPTKCSEIFSQTIAKFKDYYEKYDFPKDNIYFNAMVRYIDYLNSNDDYTQALNVLPILENFITETRCEASIYNLDYLKICEFLYSKLGFRQARLDIIKKLKQLKKEINSRKSI